MPYERAKKSLIALSIFRFETPILDEIETHKFNWTCACNCGEKTDTSAKYTIKYLLYL